MGKIERDEWRFDGWGHKTTMAEGGGAREEGGGRRREPTLSLSPMDAYDRKGGEAMAWRVTPARSVYPTKPRPKL